jgi:hypothetical protein
MIGMRVGVEDPVEGKTVGFNVPQQSIGGSGSRGA